MLEALHLCVNEDGVTFVGTVPDESKICLLLQISVPLQRPEVQELIISLLSLEKNSCMLYGKDYTTLYVEENELILEKEVSAVVGDGKISLRAGFDLTRDRREKLLSALVQAKHVNVADFIVNESEPSGYTIDNWPPRIIHVWSHRY